MSRRVGTHQLIAPASSGSRARFAYLQQSKVIGAEIHKWSLGVQSESNMLPRRLVDRLPCVAWFLDFQYNPIPYLPYLLSYLPLFPNPTCGLKKLLYVKTRGMPVCVNARFHTLHAHASLVFSVLHPSCLPRIPRVFTFVFR